MLAVLLSIHLREKFLSFQLSADYIQALLIHTYSSLKDMFLLLFIQLYLL